MLAEAKKIADTSRNSNPVAIYPWRIEMIDWFWTKSITQGHDRSSGDKQIVVHLPDTWESLVDNTGQAEKDAVHLPDTPVNWRSMTTVSRTWSNQGLRYYLPGKVIHRVGVDIPESAAGKTLTLWLGMVDTAARLWVDGYAANVVQKNGGLLPWEFDLTGLAQPGQRAVLTLEVERKYLNELGTGGLMGPAFIWTDGTAPADSGRASQQRGTLPASKPSSLEPQWAQAQRPGRPVAGSGGGLR